MRTFSHLSLAEREKLFAWKEKGLSLRKIAKRLRRNVGSVSRELKRHQRYGRAYLPYLAQRQADTWEQRQRYKAPLKCPQIFLYVREHLRMSWSPETISGRLPIEYPGYSIDDETIYRYIYGKKQKWMKLWRYLILHRKRRMKKYGRKVQAYARLASAIPITNRPETVNRRVFPGHWETDNMEGKRSDKTTVSVTIERLSRITRLVKLVDHTAKTKADTLIGQFSHEPMGLTKSLTLDRGPENSDHEKVTRKTHAVVFACNPYHSWEKGTVENTIGRIRRYIPKGKSVDEVTAEQIATVEKILNSTPRKCLGYLTPDEVYGKIQSTSRTSSVAIPLRM